MPSFDEKIARCAELAELLGPPTGVGEVVDDFVGFERGGAFFSRISVELHQKYGKDEIFYAGLLIGWRLHELSQS